MRVVKGVLDRSFEALEYMASAAQGARLSDIALRLDVPKGAAHRMLAQMCDLGWVEQDPHTAQYRLTLKLSLLGQQFLHTTGLPGLIRPILDNVAHASGELVRLTAVQRTQLRWLSSSQGAPPGLMYQPAMTGNIVLHATANGKAWLATMSDDDAVSIALGGGMGTPGSNLGPRALGTVGALLQELAATRARGYGLAVEEAEPGVAAIAVAVRAAQAGPVVGTMSIAGPLLRVTPARYVPFHLLLVDAAERLGMVWPRADGFTEESRTWMASASKA